MNRQRLSQAAIYLVPLACLLLAGGVTVYEWRRISQYEGEKQAIRSNSQMVDSLERAVAAQPKPTRIPTADLTPREQPDFLNILRIYANASAVRITKWSNGTPNAPTSGTAAGLNGTNGEEKEKKAIPGGALPVASSIEVAGAYNGIREFMYYLQRSPRLLNMTDIRWKRADHWPQTSASFTLVRYVVQPKSQVTAMNSQTLNANAP